jgi:multidrug efflux system membrane fusion protein
MPGRENPRARRPLFAKLIMTQPPIPESSPHRPHWLRRPWLWILVLCGLGAGAALYYYYPLGATTPAADGKAAGKGAGKGDPARQSAPVVAQAVVKGDLNIFLTGLGTVTPLATVTVKSRVDGQLMRVLFKEGQAVKAGELLAEIDPRPFQVVLTQVEGQAARDQSLLANARLDLERYKTLFTQDSIAKQQLDTQASLVQQYEAALKVDQGAIDSARLQLVYTRITAPISGRVGLRQVDAGNIVRAGDTTGLVVITQLQPITVVFTIPQDSLPLVLKRWQSGDKLPVEAWDREQKTRLATGALLTVDNVVDVSTGTVRLKAQFPNTDESLFPNQFVNIRLLVETQTDLTIMPAAALQRGSQGTYAYVVKDDQTVTLRPIKLGPTEGDRIAIASGLEPGERVVVDGADRLREGARVDVVTRESRAIPTGEGKGARKGGGKGKGGEGRKKAE